MKACSLEAATFPTKSPALDPAVPIRLCYPSASARRGWVPRVGKILYFLSSSSQTYINAVINLACLLLPGKLPCYVNNYRPFPLSSLQTVKLETEQRNGGKKKETKSNKGRRHHT
ncbi:hypothetical protein PoB_006303000 [Plakobranchus ocellatus]|uniref:Uncharacterized protein n=1 Tax=Plakobranchus ocellatus TaxID=259542 RepID=A0AAV4CXK3_9GAST|nr:hypothetical protein PoB_006303000 [Plakobranchus ocellatus]